MKTVAIVSKGLETCRNIHHQLMQLLGDGIMITAYCIDSGVPTKIDGDLVVITSHLITDYVIPKINPNAKVIIANRSINYNYLNLLLSIPAGSDVLLVNDVEETCRETLAQLSELGINHINFYPYYWGIKDYKPLEIAVTPGESHIVPNCIKTIIDIGTRLLDISTLIEVLINIESTVNRGNTITSQYIRTIVEITKKYNNVASEAIEAKNMFQTIIQNADDGVVYYDFQGIIQIASESFGDIVGIKNTDIPGSKLFEILPELQSEEIEDPFQDVMKIHGKNMIVKGVPVSRENKILGHILTMRYVSDIQEIEYQVRRKMRKQEHNAVYRFSDIIGKSDEMKKVVTLSKKLATNDATILIQGESGTGKEFFAQAIHNISNRKNGPFVPVNFAALPINLLESELFGYEDGAFTGAKKGGKPGLFEEAHGGTIFLDEIGDSPAELQVSLLRVLQEREVRRIGSNKRIPIDVRVISATNKNLLDLVNAGNFRRDLFYRLNVLPLHLPSLREKKSDIPILLEHYLRLFSTSKSNTLVDFFEPDIVTLLSQYNWPGNIRELVNAVEYLIHIKDPHHKIQLSDLPQYITDELKITNEAKHPNYFAITPFDWVLEQIERIGPVGRRSLVIEAAKSNIKLSEAKIRLIIAQMEESGLVEVSIGSSGTSITETGRMYLLDKNRTKSF